jgi:hypothetical protein
MLMVRMKPDTQYGMMAKTRSVNSLIYIWAYITAMPLLLGPLHPSCPLLLVSKVEHAHAEAKSCLAGAVA